ncbi:hypothetical protein K470DRAFT_260915, partial [Piedraia hortae CBS 480.64]
MAIRNITHPAINNVPPPKKTSALNASKKTQPPSNENSHPFTPSAFPSWIELEFEPAFLTVM